MKLNELTLKQALAGLRDKKFSTHELHQAVHTAIHETNDSLNIYLSHHADAPDSEWQGELAGIPIALKDNILTSDLTTTAASKVLREYVGHYEATVARRLRAAGAYLVGKTNLDAWAHGSSTETSDFGATKNPLNPAYVPGGSSGGSAAAIAANAAIAAVGTETAGSIRQPSSWCGTVGLKPTYGRVSRYGIVAMGSSLDSPGPMTKTVEDAAIMLNHLAGHDKYDGTSSTTAVPDYTKSLKTSLKGLKIGVVYLDTLEDTGVQQAYQAVIPVLESLGADVTTAQAMDPSYAIGVYAVVQRSEVSSNLARYDGIRYGESRAHFGQEAKRRIMLGTYTLSKGYADKYYVRAQQVRTRYIQDFARLFEEFDVLVAPSTPGYALKLGESKQHPYFGEMIDRLIEPCSLAGLPGINVPCFRDQKTNLALGLNVMAPAWQEERMLQVAYAYEQATQWNPWAQQEQAAGEEN